MEPQIVFWASQVELVVKNPSTDIEDLRDRGSIPGSGRSAGEVKDYPLQCSWASLVTQLIKNLSAMLEA